MEAVIFDVDGTLIDSVDLHAKAWQEAFKKFGKHFSYLDCRNQIGKGGNELLPHFLSEKEIHQFGEELKAFRSDLFKKQYMHQVKPFPDVQKLFALIKERGKKIALGSSSTQDDLSFYVNLLKIEKYLDATTNADDVEKAKPHPDIFQIALSKMNITAKRAVVVGDTPYDIEAAAKANVKTIGFLSGGFEEKILDDAGAIKIYEGPSDLLNNYYKSPIETE